MELTGEEDPVFVMLTSIGFTELLLMLSTARFTGKQSIYRCLNLQHNYILCVNVHLVPLHIIRSEGHLLY